MSRQIRADYDQIFFLPPCIEDWIPEDHPARFIRDMVDGMDLESMGFHVPDSDVGRPGYAADLYLKVWLYGYMNRVRSTRKLEKACRENMGLIWLTGMNEPDHNSLWRFFERHKEAMQELFKKSVRVAVKCKLVGMVLQGADGTKIRAISSGDKTKSSVSLEKMQEQMDRTVADFMTEVERAEQEETGEYKLPASMRNELKRKAKISNALKELSETEVAKVHYCEPEARFMKNRRSIELSYNAQAVADKDSGIIVAQDVVKDETDNGQLVPMLDKVKENLGVVAKESLADSGYFASSQIGLAEERGYEVLVNAPPSETTVSRSPATNPYHTSFFTYDEGRNCCICPHNQELHYVRTRVRGANHNEVLVFRCREYRVCPHREKCSKNKKGREVEISVHYKALERQRAKKRNPVKKKLLGERKTIIEPVFAWIKQQLGFDRWTAYGLNRVRAQWAFVCTVINLKKLYKHWISGGMQLTPQE